MISSSRSLPVKISSLVTSETDVFSKPRELHRRFDNGYDSNLSIPTSASFENHNRRSNSKKGNVTEGTMVLSGTDTDVQRMRVLQSVPDDGKSYRPTQTEWTLSKSDIVSCLAAAEDAGRSAVDDSIRPEMTDANSGDRNSNTATQVTSAKDDLDSDTAEAADCRLHDAGQSDRSKLSINDEQENVEKPIDENDRFESSLPKSSLNNCSVDPSLSPSSATMLSNMAESRHRENTDSRQSTDDGLLANSNSDTLVADTRQQRDKLLRNRQQPQPANETDYPSYVCSLDDILHTGNRHSLMEASGRRSDFKLASLTYPRDSIRAERSRCAKTEISGHENLPKRKCHRPEVGDTSQVPTFVKQMSKQRNMNFRRRQHATGVVISSCPSFSGTAPSSSACGGSGNWTKVEPISATAARVALLRSTAKSVASITSASSSTVAASTQCPEARRAWSKSQELHPAVITRAATVPSVTLTSSRRRNSIHAVFVEATCSDVPSGEASKL